MVRALMMQLLGNAIIDEAAKSAKQLFTNKSDIEMATGCRQTTGEVLLAQAHCLVAWFARNLRALICGRGHTDRDAIKYHATEMDGDVQCVGCGPEAVNIGVVFALVRA